MMIMLIRAEPVNNVALLSHWWKVKWLLHNPTFISQPHLDKGMPQEDTPGKLLLRAGLDQIVGIRGCLCL